MIEVDVDAVRDELIRVARQGEVRTYRQVAEFAGLTIANRGHIAILSRVLCSIARTEHEHGQPLLPVLVVRQDTRQPGNGFFTDAQELGRQFADRTEYFQQEAQAVWDFWDNEDC